MPGHKLTTGYYGYRPSFSIKPERLMPLKSLWINSCGGTECRLWGGEMKKDVTTVSPNCSGHYYSGGCS